MEAAWQHLDKPKEEQDLRALKLDLIQRLKLRNIPREKIGWIIEFIKYIVPFTNSEIQAKFEQDLITLNQANIPMGIREAILEDVRKQGIEQGIEQDLEQGIEIGESRGIEKGIEKGIELEKQEFTLKLWALQEFSIEKIALLVDLNPERVKEIILDFLQSEGMSEPEAQATLSIYLSKFTAH